MAKHKEREPEDILSTCTHKGYIQLSDELERAIDAGIHALQSQKPSGTESDGTYEYCPRCKHITGNSAYFCKHCGQMLRTPQYDWGYNPYQE